MTDSPLGWVLLFGFGLFTGTLAGILGIGGGLLNVPALTLAGASTLQAAATSLIGVLLSAVSGSVRNLQTGSLNWRVSLTLGGFGLVSAQVGTWLGGSLPDAALSLGFALLALITIFLMGLKRSLKQRQESSTLPSFDLDSITQTATVKTHETVSDKTVSNKTASNETASNETISNKTISNKTASNETASNETISNDNYRFVPTMSIGLLAGLLSGLFGVGGGAVMVPLQMLALNEPIKIAVRTSLGAIVAIASSALIRQSLNGHILWIPGLCLGCGGMIGAQLGTRLLPKLPDQTITTLFRVLLFALAGYMLSRGLKLFML